MLVSKVESCLLKEDAKQRWESARHRVGKTRAAAANDDCDCTIERRMIRGRRCEVMIEMGDEGQAQAGAAPGVGGCATQN